MPPAKVNWPQPGRRHPGNPITGAGEQAVTKADMRAAITQALSTSDLGTMLALGSINAEPVPGTIGIQHVSRGMLWKVVTNAAASYSITATSQTVVDSANLGGTIMCTGRPLLLGFHIRAVQRGTNQIRLGIALDGVEQGGTSGLWLRDNADLDSATAFWVVPSPQPGARRVELTASVDAGTGTIFVQTVNFAGLLALEL